MTIRSWEASIHHDGSPRYVQFGGRMGDTARLRLRIAADAPVGGVFVRTCPDGEQHFTPMRDLGVQGVCRWWEGELPIRMLRTNYRFLLRADDGVYWYSAGGVTRYYPTDANDFVLLANYHAPTWVRDAVFYQIFPDRFADGDPGNNVRDGEYLYQGRPVVARHWHELPQRATGSIEFYGGDLQGIAQRLDYLTDLGVSALYLNPIFRAPSNHKYDVEDYTRIDPHLGGEAGLLTLRQALDERTMRLVLDIVPNHCGVTHPWFVAAQADRHAPTAEFFTFRRHPDEYESWLGVKTLPKLNYRSVRLREVMYAGHDAIMRHWLRPPYRIDGWRIDVANMLGRLGPDNLGHKIGRGIRRAVKAEQPDAYLLGEHFFDGTPHLQGEELDATMNYQGFTFPVWRWLAGFEFNPQRPEADPRPIATETMAAQWTVFRAAIPWQIATQQFNLLGSHDTPRLRTIVRDDLARVRVAMTLLFTYPGVPCIYYGDEIGLAGGGDPDCRRTMPWDETQWDHDLRAFVRRLVHLRRSAPALRWGGFQQLYAQGETIVFQREAPEERLIVVARRGDDGLRAVPVRHGGLADGTRLRDLLTDVETVVTGGMLDISRLPAVGVQVWRSS
ncbi:MAG: alpha-glycosidase [Chloroflexus sp.]|uniref:maltodextrin glucosidase n=1 Tax=Chloroflexus sp. TaxID=1904827 RepID=UPI0021DBE5A1|nr:maltodextrin glucosidase [Chloroflexus sp.]GIV88588.1 MAG: alpha-glycosidase [Chloroflexus sp.]